MAEGVQLRRGTGRRARLSDAETERAMLAAGERYVAREGLSLSLEHLSMEELIADAGVSRTSSYRRWPTKDAFAGDLLLHIAESTKLSRDFAPYVEAVAAVVGPLLAGLDTAQGRRDLLVECYRALTEADFGASLTSQPWRSYLVLRAAHGGLPEGELRARVAEALRDTERGFNAYRAKAVEAAAPALGFRLRQPEAIGWEALTEIMSAVHTGMLVRAFADPDSVLTPRTCAPFGASRPAPWSLAALASGQLFFAATEADPDVLWDAERVAGLRSAAANLPSLLGQLWEAGEATEDVRR